MLLRMVRSIRWNSSVFVHFQVRLLIVCHVGRIVYIPHVSITVMYYGRFHGFSILITEITLQW